MTPITVHQRSRRHGGLLRQLPRASGAPILLDLPPGSAREAAAAEVAAALDAPLLRVSLAEVVSAYIGETEKNLAALFERASELGAVLYFDEADALFGKRTDVRDAHDRYAHVESSWFLERLRTAPCPVVIGARARREAVREADAALAAIVRPPLRRS